jgi:pterin-4a-carbinolamine dehydratase
MEFPALQRAVVFAAEAQAEAFLRALETLANRLDHHPQARIDGAICTVRWWTHEPPGLSQLDFECARQTDRLLNAEPS